jgi:ABC-type cobalamin/Fe3+-siderophores transport system ATPase subunit
MRLCKLDVLALRSIDTASLSNCGDFNVLIGKNNSGKSNLLAAVDHLFRFLALGSLATAESSLNRDVDHHNRLLSQPIKIEAILQPRADDLSQLFEDVVAEFPQVQEAMPDPGRYGYLRIELTFLHQPTTLAYISLISCCKDPASKNSDKQILAVPEAAALELASRLEELRLVEREGAFLQRFASSFDTDDWERLQQRSRQIGILAPRLRDELSPSRLNELVSMVRRTRDVEEARSAIETLSLTLRTRGEEIREGTIENPVHAFAGPTKVVPRYVNNLLGRLGECRILHLADQRKPIGADEAARLLELKMSRGGDTMLQSIQSVV